MNTRRMSHREACTRFHVSRGKLAAMRRVGLVKAVDLNPHGERAVWDSHHHAPEKPQRLVYAGVR